MSDHFSVTVRRNGEEVVTIETNSLSGRDLLPGDEDAIRTAALNLLGFIGARHSAPLETPPVIADLLRVDDTGVVANYIRKLHAIARVEHVRCSRCGTCVSGHDPELGLVVRAWVECPECLEAEAKETTESR